MKKMMKSIICVAMVMALVLSLAACGNSPKGVVKKYLKNDYNYVQMVKLLEKPSEHIEDLADAKIKNYEDYIQWCIDEDEYREEKELYGDKGFDKYIEAQIAIHKASEKRMKYTIDSVDKDDKEAWVEYTVEYPDYDSSTWMKDALEEVGVEDKAYDKISEDDWADVWKEYKKIALEDIKKADLEESDDNEIRVKKRDGKWVIAEDQSKTDED